jgi:hypothetical protein
MVCFVSKLKENALPFQKLDGGFLAAYSELPLEFALCTVTNERPSIYDKLFTNNMDILNFRKRRDKISSSSF